MSQPLEIPPSERTRLKRAAARGTHDRATIHAILDEAFIAHVAFVHDDHPAMIPIVYARIGDHVYLHGSTANRMLRTLKDGAEACLCVTLVDGLVVARAAFHTSVNYRSVVLYGRGSEVADPAEKTAALEATLEHAIPGRWKDARPPNREEFLRTLVVRIPVDEASAKVRTGPPNDDEEDYAMRCWGGVLPVHTAFGTPQPDPRCSADLEAPDYLTRYRRPGR